MTSLLLDHATLNELREALGDELDSIVRLYVQDLPSHTQTLLDLWAQRDLATLRRSAHSLKGSSVSMGAQRLGALAAQIEKLAAAGEAGETLANALATLPELAQATEAAFRESGWVSA